jgi:DNA-binding response OmpR family regulator
VRFLIVDDDPAILMIVQKLLELDGHSVECCENALDAMNTLKQNKFDILITDANMPSYSGFDLIRSVRRMKSLDHMLLAMLTGRREKGDIEQALELGVSDYIVKPIDPALFIEKMQKLTHKVKQRQPGSVHGYRLKSEIRYPISLIQVTDIGVRIESPQNLAKNLVVSMDLAPLKEVGILKNQFKVIFNSPGDSDHMVISELLLLNLTPKEQEKLSQLAKTWLQKKSA